MPDNQLIEDILNYLDISWADNSTQNKIIDIIANGIADLDEKSGLKNDYSSYGRARTLLFIRTQYEWCNAMDDFYINYRKEIIAFINRARVINAKSENP